MHIVNICFSPTGGTQRTADMLIQAMAARSTAIDLSDWQIPFSTLSLQEDDVAVIVVPSYGGRVPKPAIDRLSAINGNHARAILICVYGNRAVEDALVELQDTAEAAGFHVVAAISAIARHSIVHEIAAGRPDAQDQKTLSEFAGQIKKKLDACDRSVPSIPGSRPYKNRGVSAMLPKPDQHCTACGTYAERCPVQAIDRNDPARMDADLCISCMRCVAVCPHAARKADEEHLAAVRAMLIKTCPQRKSYALYT